MEPAKTTTIDGHKFSTGGLPGVQAVQAALRFQEYIAPGMASFADALTGTKQQLSNPQSLISQGISKLFEKGQSQEKTDFINEMLMSVAVVTEHGNHPATLDNDIYRGKPMLAMKVFFWVVQVNGLADFFFELMKDTLASLKIARQDENENQDEDMPQSD